MDNKGNFVPVPMTSSMEFIWKRKLKNQTDYFEIAKGIDKKIQPEKNGLISISEQIANSKNDFGNFVENRFYKSHCSNPKLK